MSAVIQKLIVCLLLFFVSGISMFGAEVITEIEEAGTYPVKYSYYDEATGEYVETETYVTIERVRTVINEYEGEGIDATDFVITKGTVQNLSKVELIQKARAHAWNINDGANIPIEVAAVKTINKDAGIYEVRFATAKGTATTITVLEQRESNILPTDIFIGDIGQETLIMKWRSYFLWPILILFIIICALLLYSIHQTKQADDVLYGKAEIGE